MIGAGKPDEPTVTLSPNLVEAVRFIANAHPGRRQIIGHDRTLDGTVITAVSPHSEPVAYLLDRRGLLHRQEGKSA